MLEYIGILKELGFFWLMFMEAYFDISVPIFETILDSFCFTGVPLLDVSLTASLTFLERVAGCIGCMVFADCLLEREGTLCTEPNLLALFSPLERGETGSFTGMSSSFLNPAEQMLTPCPLRRNFGAISGSLPLALSFCFAYSLVD